MKLIKTVDAKTSDSKDLTEVTNLGLETKPAAYFLNYNSHGFGKFKIDQLSLKVFEKKLSMIASEMARVQLYNTLFDMMKDGDITGAYFLDILMTNLENETNESVLSENLVHNIPAIITGRIPNEYYWKKYSAVFTLILEKMLAPKKFFSEIH